MARINTQFLTERAKMPYPSELHIVVNRASEYPSPGSRVVSTSPLSPLSSESAAERNNDITKDSMHNLFIT